MDQRNYALMSVLYDNTGADLYSDIYFPIIKYAIANIYNTQSENQRYYDLSILKSNININFGIEIPLVVLKQAIKAVYRHNNGISIDIIDNGDKFLIKKIWDAAEQDSIDNLLENTVQSFEKLEINFQLYLEREKVNSSKSFMDFFSENEEELFRFIENTNSNPIINESYIHLTKFLAELKFSDLALYNVANNIFWGSVISAFLRRNVDLNIKPVIKVNYYLDSSLILSLLDLDSEPNVSYTTEMVEMIKKTGNRACVHPITLLEIKNILFSLEKDQIPKPNSAIESAFYRRSLTPSKILNIRNDLYKLVTDKDIYIENVSEFKLQEIITKYKVKPEVIKLRETRSNISHNENNIRDIHDIYMNDFIVSKWGDISSVEKISSYFVSLNSNFISYLNNNGRANKFCSVLHPSKVISTLWIHNSKCSFIKEQGLTEVMSRCYMLNNTDVRRKIRLISKYFNQENITEEIYNDLYNALIDRSNRVLEEVSKIEESSKTGQREEIQPLLESALRIAIEEGAMKKKSMTSSSNENIHLNEELLQKKTLIEELLSKVEENKNKENEIINNLDTYKTKTAKLEEEKLEMQYRIESIIALNKLRNWRNKGYIAILGIISIILYLILHFVNSEHNYIYQMVIWIDNNHEETNKLLLRGVDYAIIFSGIGFLSRFVYKRLFDKSELDKKVSEIRNGLCNEMIYK